MIDSKKIEAVGQYLNDFAKGREEHITAMYEGAYRDRAYPGGVYSLKQGTKLMDFIIAVHGLYCEDLLVTPIIPTRYVTPGRLLKELERYKVMAEKAMDILQSIRADESVSRFNIWVDAIEGLADEVIEMVNYVKDFLRKCFDMNAGLLLCVFCVIIKAVSRDCLCLHPEDTCENYFVSEGIAGGDFCTSESPSDTRFISSLQR